MNKKAKTSLSARYTQRIFWSILLMMPIIGMAIDLIAPSLPAIAYDLQISNKVVKNVISLYLVGYALGNFVTGLLTDALGRRRLLRIALSSFIVVSVLPVVLPHIAMLLFVRLLQGFLLGSVGVLVRAISSDILSPKKIVSLGILIGTMWGLGPVVGPVIGGYLQFYIGWKAGFCFLAMMTFFVSIGIFLIVPETHTHPQPLNRKKITLNLAEVFKHRAFMSLTTLMGLAYSLIITFHTAGPFLIQKSLGYSSIFFGHAALYLGLAFLVATFVCRYALKVYMFEKILFVIITGSLTIVCIMLMLAYFFPQSIALIVIASGCMFFMCGFIFPMSMGKGISFFQSIAGTAAAVMYLVNILMTGLAAFLVSFVKMHSAIPMLWIYFVIVLLSAGVYWQNHKLP